MSELQLLSPERTVLSYHLGLFLGANAISDAFVVIDGPDCNFRKTQWVWGKHDWSSTLLDTLGEHRVANTLLTADRVIMDKGDALRERLETIARLGKAKAAFVCSMPHVAIIGTQYDRILRMLQPTVPMPLFEVPSRSLDGDWLDGYADMLTSIAVGMSIEGRAPTKGKVAVIGHLMDRNEEDQRANVLELRRMLGALGLEVASIWLDGGPYADLERAAEAELLVAFPLGRPAAEALAKRTGAKVLACDVPFGAPLSERFVREVGRATGRLDAAETFAAAELARLVPRLEWVIPHVFVGRRAVYWGAPFLFGGFLSMASEVGIETVLLGASAGDRFLSKTLDDEFGPLPPIVLGGTRKAIESTVRSVDWDLAVTDSVMRPRFEAGDAGVVEVGFPSHFEHALYPRPTLGFEGWMGMLDRMATAVMHRDRRLASPPLRPADVGRSDGV